MTHSFAERSRHYQGEYNRFPLQTHKVGDYLYDGDYDSLRAILRGTTVLTNENPHRTDFIRCSPRALDKQGRFVDPWGNLYHVVADWSGDGK